MRPAKVLKEAFSAAGFAVGRLDIVLVYKKSSQAARWAERYHSSEELGWLKGTMLIGSRIWLRQGQMKDPKLIHWLGRLESRAEELVQNFVS
jgi:hypothetical protein